MQKGEIYGRTVNTAKDFAFLIKRCNDLKNNSNGKNICNNSFVKCCHFFLSITAYGNFILK